MALGKSKGNKLYFELAETSNYPSSNYRGSTVLPMRTFFEIALYGKVQVTRGIFHGIPLESIA